MAAAVESMDTTSPPASPAAATESNVTVESQSKKFESEDSSNHSSSEDSNGPVENNNDGSEHSETDKGKSNGVIPEDSRSQESSDSQPKPELEKKTESSASAKQSLIGVSDTESRAHTNDDDSSEDSNDELDSSEEGSEDGSGGGIAKAVSVNSESEPETVDDDSSGQSETEADIVMIDNPSEVHEIVSDDDDDDCVVTNDEGIKSLNGGSITDNDSDVEETSEDPLNHSDVKISNTPKSLLKPVAPGKDTAKNNSSVVLIDTQSILSGKEPISLQPPKTNSSIIPPTPSLNSANVTNAIVKLNVNSNTSNQIGQTDSIPLLPTLTDDMFVVEAPSFIVPYVYEKPSIEQFRKFVDGLGKELDEKRAKEEKERLEKEKEEKEKRQKEKEERKAKGETVEDSEEEEVEEEKNTKEDDIKEILAAVEKKAKKDDDKKRKGRRRKIGDDEDDDESWEGGSDTASEDEAISEDDELTTVVLKDKDGDSIEEIKTIATNLTADPKPAIAKSESFFDNNLGKFFMNIGLNLVQEYVQTDLLKQQKRNFRKESKSTRPDTKAIEVAIRYLSKNVEMSKTENAPYKFKQKNCKFCFFRTESDLVMAHHLETPHMKNNVYTCNFCPFEVRSPHDILFHMEAEHNTRSRLERAPAYHQCANCPFEDNGKGKLARHLIACAKKFKPDLNLAPPVDWEPPAKIPKLTRPRVNMSGGFNRPQGSAPLGRPPIISGAMPILGRPRGPAPGLPRGSFVSGAPLIRGGLMMRHSTPQTPNFPLTQNMPGGKIVHQPSISITPLPRTPQPQASTPPARTQGSFVICEICDGYIKDLEQLRSHMQWIHKVKIHPKMIYNRPPLNCQKCQFRFFTDQGLERHLLGSHGLVTSSMQETANQGKDSGRCPVCGRVYQWKLLNHVAKDHNMTLKPAHLSYKCTVCTATFGMYKQFESHVYSMHSAVGKKVADNKPVPRMVGNSSITIVPAGKTGAKV